MAKPLPGVSTVGVLGFWLATAALAGSASAQPAQGTGQSYGNPQLQRELDYGTGKNDGGSLFNSANPIDLMNKLRKSSSLDDATTPQDAVDAALKGLNAQSVAKPAGPAGPVAAGSPTTASPAAVSPAAGSPASHSPAPGSVVSGSPVSPKAP